jgi:cation/acetate symporter
VAAIIVALSLVAALAAAFAGVGVVAAIGLAMVPTTAITIAAVLVFVAAVLGGMRAVTLTAVVQYIVMAATFLTPAVFASLENFSTPLPWLSFGRALAAASLLGESVGELAKPIPGTMLPFAPATGIGFFAAMASLAAGVAALPHLVARSATSCDVAASRRSAGWSLLFLLAIALTAPAYAAFARLAIMRDVAGLGAFALPSWVFALAGTGLLKACSSIGTSPAAVSAACAGGPVAASQIAISGDAIVLAWREILGLPYVAGILIPLGGLAAGIAAASAIALAIGVTLGHDIYARLIALRGSAGRHLAVTRLMLAGVVLIGAWLGAKWPGEAFRLSLSAIALAGGSLFPALFAAVWWRRATAVGAIAGMVAGALATVTVIAACRYPGLLPLGGLDPRSFDLSELSAAVVGLPVGFVVIVIVSLVTAAPSAEQREVLDLIRRPGGRPFVRENEG